MLVDYINTQLEEGRTVIKAKGMISEIHPQHQIWGEVSIRNFVGEPISANMVFTTDMEARMCAFLSGSALLRADGSYPELYKIDSCHHEIGLHEHDREETFNIEETTVGSIISRFFKKASEN